MNSAATKPGTAIDEAETTTEPAWEIARLFPDQGAWTEEEYLALPDRRLVEFSQGFIEVLTMPTTTHQWTVLFLYRMLEAFCSSQGKGTVLVAPLKVRLWPGKFRDPDVVMLLAEHERRIGDAYWDGADLVMEIVSEDDRGRDLDVKRREYARAGILEYWIVDPREEMIRVLSLQENFYNTWCEARKGERARSRLLADFSVAGAEVFAAPRFSGNV